MRERRPVQHVIADDLRGRILGRDLAKGAMLPSEAPLAARYTVTRVTANRAVRVLRDEGLVVHRHSVGWFAAVPALVAGLHRVQDALTAGRPPDPSDVEILATVIPQLWADRRSPLLAEASAPARLTATTLIDRAHPDPGGRDPAVRRQPVRRTHRTSWGRRDGPAGAAPLGRTPSPARATRRCPLNGDDLGPPDP